MSEANSTQNPNRLGVIDYDQGFLNTAPFLARAHGYTYDSLPIRANTTIDDAVNFVRDRKPSLLFLPVNWSPGVADKKGLEALVRISQLENPPVVYATSGDQTYHEEATQKGATGYLTLGDPDQFTAALEKHKSETKKRYALVVDDDNDIINIVTESIESFGVEVTTAKDGLEAKSIYQSRFQSDRPFDVVFSDVMMTREDQQRADGSVILEIVKTLTPDVPVIMWSGYSIDSDYKRTFDGVQQLQPDYTLQKPNLIPELKKLIPILLTK